MPARTVYVAVLNAVPVAVARTETGARAALETALRRHHQLGAYRLLRSTETTRADGTVIGGDGDVLRYAIQPLQLLP